MIAAESPRHVLVVDDDDDARTAMSSLLRAFGQRVAEAENGTRGLALILSLRPDVSLVDIDMHDLDGYELATRVRAEPGGERLFLIAMTGHGRPQDREHALRSGFDAHLLKPVDERELIALISSRDAATESGA